MLSKTHLLLQSLKVHQIYLFIFCLFNLLALHKHIDLLFELLSFLARIQNDVKLIILHHVLSSRLLGIEAFIQELFVHLFTNLLTFYLLNGQMILLSNVGYDLHLVIFSKLHIIILWATLNLISICIFFDFFYRL